MNHQKKYTNQTTFTSGGNDWKTRDIFPKWWFVTNNQISLVGGFNPPGNMLVKIGSFLKVFSVQKTYLKPPLSSLLQSYFSNLTLIVKCWAMKCWEHTPLCVLITSNKSKLFDVRFKSLTRPFLKAHRPRIHGRNSIFIYMNVWFLYGKQSAKTRFVYGKALQNKGWQASYKLSVKNC